VATARSVIARGTKSLAAGPHPERAQQDAETLLLGVLETSRAWLLAHMDEELEQGASIRYMVLLSLRSKGQPIQYIAGQCEFYGLPIRVSAGVLIPRPETEHLVDQALLLAARFRAPRIVDVGTGSGCIAIALAHHLPEAKITAIDLSSKALIRASESAALNQVLPRIRLLEGDLLAPVAGEQFEIVVSNPPYIPEGDRDSLSVEVREHEPSLALFAGEDGLDVYRRLIPEASAVLEPGGFLLMEIGYGQSEPVADLLAQAGFSGIDFVSDLQSIPRVACAQRPQGNHMKIVELDE
jgi:release factor glutamine methyltransferase